MKCFATYIVPVLSLIVSIIALFTAKSVKNEFNNVKQELEIELNNHINKSKINQTSEGDGSHSQSTTGDGSHPTIGNGNDIG